MNSSVLSIPPLIYREFADEYKKLARSASDGPQRVLYLKMANMWEHAAVRFENGLETNGVTSECILDKVRFYCAAAYMCAKAHDTKLSNLTFEDICKFMDSLDEDDAGALGEFANEFEYRDGAVWFGDKRVMWMPTMH